MTMPPEGSVRAETGNNEFDTTVGNGEDPVEPVLTDSQDYEVVATFNLWLVIALATLTYGTSISLPIGLSVMFLDWQESFQTSRARTAAIYSTSVGFLIATGVISGYLTSKLGARVTILAGSVIASAGFLLSMFGTRVEHLIVTTGILGGSGCCLIYIPIIPVITEMIEEKYRGLVIALSAFTSGVFIAAYPSLYRSIVEHNSWRLMYLVNAGIIIHACVSGMIITSFRKVARVPSAETAALTSYPHLSDRETASVLGKKARVDEEFGRIEGTVVGQRKAVRNGSGIAASLQFHPVEFDEPKPSKTVPIRSFCGEMGKALSKIKTSKWRFCTDRLYIVFSLQNAFCHSFIFLFPLLFPDLAKTKGFDESAGILFMTVHYSSSLFGRILVGLLNISPRFHSIVLFVGFSALCGMVMLFLSFINSYTIILVALVFNGIGYGAVIVMQLKCIVDIKAIAAESYPLAFGMSATIEGICDLVFPIIVGHIVDLTGSYTVILIVIACLCLLFSAWLGLEFFRESRQERAQAKVNREGCS